MSIIIKDAKAKGMALKTIATILDSFGLLLSMKAIRAPMKGKANRIDSIGMFSNI
jgi:hypothetical protein